MEPRLADFGLSKILTEADGTRTATETAGVLGSLRWMAKELFDSDRGVTCQSDIWAFAMTALVRFFAQVPVWAYLACTIGTIHWRSPIPSL